MAHYPYEGKGEDVKNIWPSMKEWGYKRAMIGPASESVSGLVGLGNQTQEDLDENSQTCEEILSLPKDEVIPYNWLLPNLMDRRSEKYSDQIARCERNGSVIPEWETGHQKLNPVCPVLMEDLMGDLWDTLTDFSGHHFDTMTMESLHECWNKDHRCTRTLDKQCRISLSSRLAAQGDLIMSEAGSEWAVPHFHMLSLHNFGHHIVNTKTGWNPVPFPLFSLAFRECVMSCWHETDAWHDSRPEDKRLYDISIGCVPTLNACGKMHVLYEGNPDSTKTEFHTVRFSDPKIQDIIKTGVDVAELAEKTWGMGLESYEYIDEKRLISKTIFIDGPTIWVNRSEEIYNSEGVEIPARDYKVC